MISDDNKKFTVILPKTFYYKLQQEALYEDRSISNMTAKIIKDYYQNKDKNGK